VSWAIRITPEARADIAEAKAWYERQHRGLGEELVLCVEEALDRIARLPEGYREVVPGVRRVIVKRFPYGVFYRVEPQRIVVMPLYHAKRDPRGWRKRV
jgi:plasmid stabilization system protein ParE